ncbi:MAG: tRNA (adenosine(37)-N6)-threonylcarbamoyltransferase complex dimerization subunit type 1 TsaB, partial [Lysobacter spongiicola]|nr:tRNA (adenosine(37)-N6)-threonylcarbamoyltransferase complex dimerization subunit type 1 TsaB [Lysobacter spongiicola]
YRQGAAVAPEAVEPAYLRNNVALTSQQQQELRDARR